MTNWLIVAGVVALAIQAYDNRRRIMANVDDAIAAVDAARSEIEADKVAIIAEIQRLGLPDADLQPLIDKVQQLGSVLDDVPGVTPLPPVEPPVDEEPVEEEPTV
jgi:hypothetical protein